jgi:hypothetical protein
VTGAAKSRSHTATHAVPVMHGSPVCPLSGAAAMPAADAAHLVWHMADRYQPPTVAVGR